MSANANTASPSSSYAHGPHGYVHPAFQPVLGVFRESFNNGIDKGASFAAYYKGELVVSLWGGLADEKAKRPWKEDTLGHFHSSTKFMVAVCVAHLVERGLLDYEQKVSHYWPEFSQNGKQDINVALLLAHRAGLAALSTNYELGYLRDNQQKLSQLLAEQKPLWEPGQHHGYHSLTFGLYIDELIKRVDPKGRNAAQYFQEEFAQPFGIDFHIGLPKDLHYRAARLEPQHDVRARVAQRMENHQGDPEVFRLASTQPRDWNSRWKLNDPDFGALPCSSSHGVGSARAAAKFASIFANGGKFEEKTLLSPKSIELLQRPLSMGKDLYLSEEGVYGLGTLLIPAILGGRLIWFMPGHSGYGGQNLVADTKFKVGWAYVTNYVDPFHNFQNSRWKPLFTALYDCILKLEGTSEKIMVFDSYKDALLSRAKRSKV